MVNGIKTLCFYLIKVEVCAFIKKAEKSKHGVWFVVNGLPLQSPAFVTTPCRLCTQWLHGSVLKRTARVYSYQMYNYYHIWICVHTLPHMPLRHTSCLFFPPCLSPSWSINTLSSAEVGSERRWPRPLSVQQSSDLWRLRLVLTLHLSAGSINDGGSVAPWMEGRNSLSVAPPLFLSLSLSTLCPVIISVIETSSKSPGSINSARSGDNASSGLWWEL